MAGDALLVEHNPARDAFWSDEFDGRGKNMLGSLWMELRSELRGEPVRVVADGVLIATLFVNSDLVSCCLQLAHIKFNIVHGRRLGAERCIQNF